MRNISALFALFFMAAGIPAHAVDFYSVDTKVKAYPSAFSSVDMLAAHIGREFSRDEDKARALFTWMAINIRYDSSPMAAGKRDRKISYSTQSERNAKIAAAETDLASRTLRLKRGVCNGYATLYRITARKMGLECEIIYGSAKSNPAQIGKGPEGINHAWNAVKINGAWKLLDVTWGAGGFGNSSSSNFDDRYFFTRPDLFFLNHFPDNSNWLLTDKTGADFAALPLYYDLRYEMISPLKGVVTTGTGSRTSFKINGIKKADEVMYQYTSGAFANKVLPKITNGVGEFGLVLGANAKGTLTIFVNKKPFVSYKLAPGN